MLWDAAVDGKWFDAKQHITLPDPMNGDAFMKVPNPTTADTQPYVDALKRVPKTGLHNPFKVGLCCGYVERSAISN